ncbi:MAG: phytanoyl-CoA dioxygenase family protein [Xanthomonadales bacterium]|nr:phytanoyl-CoA dioxygenase family protein [Xanthomonadales bacterium]
MDLQQTFERDGYAVIENAFSAEAIASVRQAAARIVDEFDIEAHRSVFSTLHRDSDRDRYFMDSAEAVHCFLEEEALDAGGNLTQSRERAINKIGHALHDLVPEFSAFCRQDVIRELLGKLGYQDPLLWQSMYIFKQPRIGGEVRWHQDASYLISEPSTVVGFWVAIEDARKDNGCLWVEPGGQHRPLSEIYEVDPNTKRGVLKQLKKPNWPGHDEAVPVEVPAGSLVMFSDHMPHYSSPNRSEYSRQAFTMHFAESSSAWPEKNWLQRPTLPPFRL